MPPTQDVISIETISARNIFVNSELWGTAIDAKASLWAVYKIDLESGDMRCLGSTEGESSIPDFVQQCIANEEGMMVLDDKSGSGRLWEIVRIIPCQNCKEPVPQPAFTSLHGLITDGVGFIIKTTVCPNCGESLLPKVGESAPFTGIRRRHVLEESPDAGKLIGANIRAITLRKGGDVRGEYQGEHGAYELLVETDRGTLRFTGCHDAEGDIDYAEGDSDYLDNFE